jgi:hypothetical protein
MLSVDRKVKTEIPDKEYGRCLQDMPREFCGSIEPDKVEELGLGNVMEYETTTDRKYLRKYHVKEAR